jgi:hypothetical protein
VHRLDLALQKSKIFLPRITSRFRELQRQLNHRATPRLHIAFGTWSSTRSDRTNRAVEADSFQLADNTPRIPDIFPMATRALMTTLLTLIG